MIEGVKKFEMPINGVRLPKFKTDNDKYGKSDGSKEQNFELIKNICLKRLKEIGKDKDAKYIDQLKYELDILNELDFVDYILLVWDIINYCKKNDIPVGPGRGCLHKETKILTYKNRFKPCENKYKPISKIRVGDTVYDKDYKKSRVEKVFKYRVRETLYSFITYGRKCQTAVTGDHKILAQKKGESQFDWHKAEDIKIGDTIAACSQPKQNYVFLPFSFNCDPDYVREKIYLRNTDKINLDEIAERSGFPVDKISSYQRGNRHIAKKDAQRINETLFAMKIGLEDFYAIRTNKEIVKRRKFFLTNGARFMYRRYVINGALNKLNVTLYFDNYETAQLNKVKKYLREFFGSYYDLMVDEKSTGQRIRLIIKSDIIRNILIECDAVEKRSYFGEPVKEIKSILANGFVYDLMVENDPSYHTYDQIVHNSAAGSLVLYLTQITQVDPIRYNLYFERFVSKVRAKKQVIDGITYLDGSLMVDIDFDICYYKRPDLLKYIENKYHGKSCKILNLNTLTAKILIKDIGKIVGQYSETQMNEVSSMIPSEFGKVKDLDWCYENVEDFKNWVETDERSKKVYNTALNLKDLIKNKAVHASGIIIAHDDLDNCCPIELTSDKDYVSAFSKDDAASILVKIDALGLKTLSIIDETCKAIGIKPQDIDPEDPFIYQQLQDLKHPKGLFQIEADCAFGVCRKVKPKSLEGLSAVMSLARPGALEFVDQYAKFSEHGLDGPAGSGSNKLDQIMGVTGNTILFQEQLMKIASEVFELSLDDAELIRRAVGKKKIKEMEKFKAIIEKQGNKLNIPDAAQFYWDALEASANYSFNSSHSISYATLSAQTIYLKFKYPKEFFCALLRMANNEQDSTEEIALIEKEMEAFGVKILPPSIISSKDDFTIEGDCIRYGLLPIKGVSKVSLRKIDDFRESFLTQKGEVTKRLPNKFAFFESAKNYKIPMNVICPLIQAGAIDGHYNQSRSKLVLECQIWNKMTEREKKFAMDIGKKHDYDLILVINELKTMTDEKDKPVFKISKSYNRLNTLRDACSPYQSIYKQNSKNEEFANWYYETKLIGYSISYRLKNALNLKGVDLIGLEEKDDYVEDKMITCGVVKKVEEATSKNGNPYVKIHLTDEKSFCKVMVFSRNRDKAFAANAEGAPPKKDNIVCVSGQVKDGGTIWSDLVTVQDKKIYMKLSELA